MQVGERTALPAGFEEDFVLPGSGRDQYGNPVAARGGSYFDASAGYAFEIWLERPRMEFVLIPPGEFSMGSPDSEADRCPDEVVHPVRITTHAYMAKYEVTQAQWREVMGGNPSEFEENGPGAPVEQVSWHDCAEFCGRTGLSLPTEAQWEYACRAGTTTPFSPGATLLTVQANYDGRRPSGGAPAGVFRKTTCIVGTFPPNPWGLYDMHGNVFEWCLDARLVPDFYGRPEASEPDPLASSDSSEDRILRGGAWYLPAANARSAARCMANRHHRFGGIGFRPVKPVR